MCTIVQIVDHLYTADWDSTMSTILRLQVIYYVYNQLYIKDQKPALLCVQVIYYVYNHQSERWGAGVEYHFQKN